MVFELKPDGGAQPLVVTRTPGVGPLTSLSDIHPDAGPGSGDGGRPAGSLRWQDRSTADGLWSELGDNVRQAAAPRQATTTRSIFAGATVRDRLGQASGRLRQSGRPDRAVHSTARCAQDKSKSPSPWKCSASQRIGWVTAGGSETAPATKAGNGGAGGEDNETAALPAQCSR